MGDPLVGAWELVEFVVEFADGTVRHPMGEDAVGQLIYDSSGRMSAMLSRANRAPLAVDRLESFHRADVGAKAAAFDGFMSYAGTYEYDGEVVVHSVEMASVPDIVGEELDREVTLEDRELTLAYAIETARGLRYNVLRWARVFALR